MAKRVLVLVGTKKGAFIAESDEGRSAWQLRGPFCKTWPIFHTVWDETRQAIVAGGGNAWFGPAVWRSEDLGATWTHSSAGLTYEEGEAPIVAVWSMCAADGALYAGVEPAGLFRSDDGGATWGQVRGLRDHPTRPDWQPGGGGLCLHSIVVDRADARRQWVGISAAGVFVTEDGGATWETRNRGTLIPGNPMATDESGAPTEGADWGQCVHHVEQAADGGALYQQNHLGFYRSDDGGRAWSRLDGNGLPSAFGFAMATHPTDAGTVYALPLNGDILGRYMPDGAAAVWRTQDGGASWQAQRKGLPQQDAYFGVLRQGMAVDTLDVPGVYFGTNTGQLFVSADEGGSWRQIEGFLPPISSVEVAVIDG